MKRGFDQLRCRDLAGTDVLLGADICFWDNMVDPLRRLINRAKRAGVKLVLIADPVRSPFEELCEYFIGKRGGALLHCSVQRPREILGQILKIT
jgi:hypothetical protein